MYEEHEHHNQDSESHADPTTTDVLAPQGQYQVLAELVERVSALNEYVAKTSDAKLRLAVRDLAVLDHIADNAALPRSAVAALMGSFSSSTTGSLTDARIASLLNRYEQSGLVELLPGRLDSGRWEGTWAMLTKAGFEAIGREPTDEWKRFTKTAHNYLDELSKLAPNN